MIKTVVGKSTSKLVVKKSQFFGYIFPIKSEDEVKNIVNSLRKKGVGHVAYAFEVNGNSNYSDDGEPSKTAGMPLFNIIKYNKLQNVLVCVARIFGGVLLGTGGLISAYGDTGREALNNNKIVEKEELEKVEKEMSFPEFGSFEKQLKRDKVEYSLDFKADKVIVTMFIPKN